MKNPVQQSLFVASAMLLSVWATVGPGSLSAQTDRGGEAKRVVRFPFQTFFLAQPETVQGGDADQPDDQGSNLELYYLQDGEYRPVNLAPNNLGLRHVFEGPLPFRLYEERKDEEGTVFYAPVAQLEGGLEGSEPGHQIVLVRPDQEGGYQLKAIAAGAGVLEAGQILVLNGSRFPLAARAGTESPARIAPGAAAVADYQTNDDYRFRLEIAEGRDGDWRLIYNSGITQVRPEPLFLVVSPNSRSNNLWNVRFLRLDRREGMSD